MRPAIQRGAYAIPGTFSFFDPADNAPTVGSTADGTGFRQSGYIQQSSSLFGHRLHLMAGVRWDQIGQVDFRPVTPQASAAWQLAARTQIQFGYGRYAEFPDFQELATPCGIVPGPASLVFARQILRRSDQYTAALEQRLSENIRLRVEGFARENQNIFGSETVGPTGCSSITPNSSLSRFIQVDNSRGLQVVLQRRSANRLSGWIGYTLDYARQSAGFNANPSVPPLNIPTPTDQRHTVNAFAMYRVTPSINLSGKMIIWFWHSYIHSADPNRGRPGCACGPGPRCIWAIPAARSAPGQSLGLHTLEDDPVR